MNTQETPITPQEKRHTPEVSPYKVSTHHLTKMVKEILKSDEVMDGSGHLYVSPAYRDKITPDLITATQARVLARLAQDYPDQAELIEKERVHALVGCIISGAAQRRKPQSKRPPQPKKGRASHKAAKPRQAKDHHQHAVKPRRHEEKHVIEVVVKKARPSFHYPRDLVIPGRDS